MEYGLHTGLYVFHKKFYPPCLLKFLRTLIYLWKFSCKKIQITISNDKIKKHHVLKRLKTKDKAT